MAGRNSGVLSSVINDVNNTIDSDLVSCVCLVRKDNLVRNPTI